MSDRPANPGRRKLFGGAAATVPLVLTLQTGTAWAISMTGCQDELADRDLTDPEVVDTISPSCQVSIGVTTRDPWRLE
ncbi:MAG TPA: hypothetical protein VK943_16350 [Arenibaculum sp.]|nr:hypothetical protein [Arenibaculum sp.]